MTIPANSNQNYKSPQISQFYKQNRCSWAELYNSERSVFSGFKSLKGATILDLGCGCGGLGRALSEKFEGFSYTGIEINQQAVDTAKSIFPPGTFVCSDILDLDDRYSEAFSLVISLSCIDWNVEVLPMLTKAWSFVSPGGSLLLSVRMTEQSPSLMDINQSYQYINFSGSCQGEIAQYTVFNKDELIQLLSNLDSCSVIEGNGYPGAPSKTAVTPFEMIIFAVLVVKKAIQPTIGSPNVDIDIS